MEPRTPQKAHRAHDQINELYGRLWKAGLPVKPSDEPYSPSRRSNTRSDECKEKVKYLFYRNKPALYDVVDTFEKDIHAGLASDLLEVFLDRLKDPVYVSKGLPSSLSPAQSRLIRQDSVQTKPADPPAQVAGQRRKSDDEVDDNSTVKYAKLSLDDPGDDITQPSTAVLLHKANTDASRSFGDSAIGMSFHSDLTVEDCPPSSAYGSEDFRSQGSQLMNLGANNDHESEWWLQDEVVERSDHLTNDRQCDLELSMEDAPSHQLLEELHGRASRTESGAKSTAISYQVRDFPNCGFCLDESFKEPSALPFALRWEYLRAMLHCGGDSFAPTQATPANFRQVLYDVLDERGKQTTFRYTGPNVWHFINNTDPQPDVPSEHGLMFEGELMPDSAEPGRSMSLSLQPLKLDKLSRLQRRYGVDRFLTISLPEPRTFASVLPGFALMTTDEIHRWMLAPKFLLGREWRAFHVERYKRRSEKTKTPWENEIISWMVPWKENARQSFCKAFSRLDLSLSRTQPIVQFAYGEVQNVADVMADGMREDAAFNDPSLAFPISDWNVLERPVMNDGCSLVSVGAALSICEHLGIRGSERSTAFQGRINGAKGVWIISAPYDTQDTDHLRMWIHISKSQRKVHMREQDMGLWTFDKSHSIFELLNRNRSLVRSSLYLDFIPILEDRGVPSETLQDIVATQLDLEYEELLEALDDSVKMRIWLEKHYGDHFKRKRESGVDWIAGLPSEGVEKAILMLESGFRPTTCHYLALQIDLLVQAWLKKMLERLKLRLDSSTSVLGVVDPTGTLKPGEVQLMFSSSFTNESTQETWHHLAGDVLIARHPSLRGSDIQKVRAVRSPNLAHMTNVLVFSAHGCIPLASKLQGGDYDGDTFWVCWDKRLVRPFRNAPVDLRPPTAQTYAIETDKRTLGELLGQTDRPNVERWLSESFRFRLRDDMLGIVTNYHKRLAYHEGSICSKGVLMVADVHNLIIDAAKNGYIFGRAEFNAFLEKHHLPPNLSKPLYEAYIQKYVSRGPDFKQQQQVLKKSWKKDWILDNIMFETVDPRIDKFRRQVATKLFTEPEDVADLKRPWLDALELAKTQSELKDILLKMKTETEAVARAYGNKNHPENPSRPIGPEYPVVLSEFGRTFNAIVPSDTDNLTIRAWQHKAFPGIPSHWELLRASALFCARHRESQPRSTNGPRSTSAVFILAGRELCKIKANSRGPETRHVVMELYKSYKPGKSVRDTTVLRSGNREERVENEDGRVTGDEDDDDDDETDYGSDIWEYE